MIAVMVEGLGLVWFRNIIWSDSKDRGTVTGVGKTRIISREYSGEDHSMVTVTLTDSLVSRLNLKPAGPGRGRAGPGRNPR